MLGIDVLDQPPHSNLSPHDMPRLPQCGFMMPNMSLLWTAASRWAMLDLMNKRPPYMKTDLSWQRCCLSERAGPRSICHMCLRDRYRGNEEMGEMGRGMELRPRYLVKNIKELGMIHVKNVKIHSENELYADSCQRLGSAEVIGFFFRMSRGCKMLIIYWLFLDDLYF